MARYKQTFDNSCGAVALMCAASELGVDRLPKYGKWQAIADPGPGSNDAAVTKALFSWDGKKIEEGIANGGTRAESAIYAVTSGDLTSYSMPSRVINCAKLLGLECKLYMGAGFYSSVLNWKYDTEMNRCTKAGCEPISATPPAPLNGERSLIVFSTWAIGLHYIMRRPDDETYRYMDPGDGTDYTNFEALNSWKKRYTDTQIHIVLSKGSAA